MAWVRLRQVALVAPSLEPVVGELSAALGLRVAYRDPAVAMFGLRNAVLPVGSQFVEVVSPLPGPDGTGTAAGRHMGRLGGGGGYMVICHTDDQEKVRSRAASLGVRVAFEADEHGYRILQLHPRDTGGSFLEVDYQPGGSDPWGPWTPAGPDWRSAVSTEVVDGLAGVSVASADVERTASVWAALLGVGVAPSDGRGAAAESWVGREGGGEEGGGIGGDGPMLHLDNAVIRFVPGPVDALVAVSVTGPSPGSSWSIGGVRFEAADPRGG